MAILRAEPFLDTTKIDSLSGTSLGINRPARYAGNPLWPILPDTTQDHNVGYSSAHYDGTKTMIWVNGFPQDASTVHLCYAESTDGVTITRPNQGLVTYNGNTTNNIVSPNSQVRNLYHVTYDEGNAQPYVLISSFSSAGLPDGIRIFRSADGKNWGSALKSMSNVTGNNYNEPMSIWKRSDGRWVIYIQTYISSNRGVGMLLGPSDGSLSGTWTYVGEILTGTTFRQYYHASAWVHEEHVYTMIGLFGGYNGTPPVSPYTSLYDRIWTVALYVGRSDDGSALTLKDEDWLSTQAATPGAWDSSEIIGGNTIVEVGNEWRYYYGGDTNPHHTTEPEGDRLWGLATLGRRRIGKVSSNGSVTLSAISTGPANVLVTGTSTASGGIQVELLNSTTGAVLAGYSRTDCDTIGTDVFDSVVTWQGVSATPASFKIKAYLTNATLNFIGAVTSEVSGIGNNTSVGIGTATAATQAPLTISGATGWIQNGTQLSVTALPSSTVSTAATVRSTLGGTLIFTGPDAAEFFFSSNGTTWFSTLDIAPGTRTIYLRVAPMPGDQTLVASVGVPL